MSLRPSLFVTVGLALSPDWAIAQQLEPLAAPIPKPAIARLDSELNRLVAQLEGRSEGAIAAQAPLSAGGAVAVSVRTA
jgi:hypothetical protein